MKLGFTGTRFGMTDEQKAVIRSLFATINRVELHHGDCVGADADAHEIARQLGGHVVIHPPVSESHRANCAGDELRARKTHFARNRDIVQETKILIATPFTMQEEDRGGTWYTVNYARKVGRWLIIIWPDGSVKEELSL